MKVNMTYLRLKNEDDLKNKKEKEKRMSAKNIEQLAEDFEKYVKKFDELREVAIKFKTTPGLLTDMFFEVGLEALVRTEAILHKEFESKLDKVFVDLKERKDNKIKVDK